LPPANSASRR
jgi:hypothetical protein